MAENAEDELVLKEWAPLSDLLQKLPSKHGVFGADLSLTCVDAADELIVLGTNLGIIYCYNRATHKLDRLKCEIIDTSVSCIKIISSVDFMVACGNRDGNINVFQIPKKPSDLLPANLRSNEKHVERYTVSEMHKGRVTALEWSKNAMKLFSGDASGRVVLTEIDFHMHLCKSMEILDEAYHVVQLSYRQHLLLVSTIFRTIICQQDFNWKLSQVGCKERKILGSFGGVIKQVGIRPTDLILYCVRPGLRLWEAEITGQVNRTILFKHSEIMSCPYVGLVNPKPVEMNVHQRCVAEKEIRFGVIHNFLENFLITCDHRRLYVINITSMQVISQINQLRDILDVAVCNSEIFVLEGSRSLIRIAAQPENDVDQGIPLRNSFANVSTSLRTIGNRLQTSIINAEPTKSAYPLKSPLDIVSTAEEAEENLSKSNETSPEHLSRHRQFEIYKKISQQDYDQVIKYSGTTRRKVKDARRAQNEETVSLANETNCIAPVLMKTSFVAGPYSSASPTAIWQDINEKETLLADVLKFESVKVNLPTLDDDKELKSIAKELDKDITILDCRPEADQDENVWNDEGLEIHKLPECIHMPINWSISDINVSNIPPPQQSHRMSAEPPLVFKGTKSASLNESDDFADWEIV